ncbi:hypothetical protein BT63DRAFT_36241 [Microthyrium microscopicum]|uniref:DUF6987 domain-containing protein n=1 Tax=Microthyrium microscopicum TaxID=703497 RepID=A0A6A6UUF2_9PEZI|nr:hypothetical protein BT63DRAFT_36241 [Microthyrium microscopicum]
MSSRYQFYSFPPTPSRISPTPSSSRAERDASPTPPSRKRKNPNMAPSPAAGKANPKTPTKLARKPQQAASGSRGQSSKTPSTPQAPKTQKPDVEDDVEDTKEQAEDAPSNVGSKVSNAPKDLEEKAPEPEEDVEEATGGATEGEDEEPEEDEEDDDATEKAGDTAISEDADDTEDATEGVKKTGSSLAGGAKNLASRGAGAAGKLGKGDLEGVKEEATGTVDDAGETAGDAAEGVKDTAEDATGQELPDVPGVELLTGLEVDDEGLIHDSEGNAIGHLVEGDAEDLAGYTIGDDGEILDDDGDLVGRCELLPEKAKELLDEAKSKAEGAASNVPGLEVLKGLTVDATGNILNDDGDTIGQLTEGDPHELMGRTLNEKGEFLDDDGNVIGRAQVHPDAGQYIDGFEEDAEDAGEDVGDEVDGAGEDLEDGAEGAQDEAGEAVDGAEDAVDEQGEAIDAELPGIEALEGHEINSDGDVLDQEGNVIGNLAEGDIDQVKGMTINDQGEVLDEEGNVIGKVELAEGAQEILARGLPDLRILDGLKVNKKGKILNSDGEELGELVDGDIAECAGKKVNEKGEVLDKSGNVIGRVKVIPGEAADEAMKELADVEEEANQYTPGLDVLEGLKVNKKGQILNEDGDVIGELVDGDIEKCAGQKCNEKGEVLDKKGNVIGRVKTLPQAGENPEEEGAEEGAEGVEGEEAKEEGAEEGEEGDDLPPLSILEGLKVNKAGKLINSDGVIVGELVEGDAKKLSKLGTQADDQGQFWDNKGHVIGRAKTVAAEDPDEEGAFAGLEGLIVNKDGYVEDENGNVVGVVTEGDAKKLVGRAVDEDGDIIDKRGSVVGHAERYEEEEVPEAEEEKADLSILAGKILNKQGNVIGDEGVPIGRLVEGNAKDLAGRRCDENGLIFNDTGKQVGRCELIPENERVAKAEGPFAGYEGLRVVKDGKVEDEDGNVVGVLTEGNAKRLVGHAVDEDGDIIDKYGNVKGHAEPYEEEDTPEVDLSALAGCTVNKAGNVVDSSGAVVGRVSEGELKNMIGRKVDGQGQIWDNSGNVIGKAELVSGQDTSPEGPFAGFDSNTVAKDGTVQTADGTIIGRVIEGDVKKLVGHKVDEDGDITDKNGNSIGKAERWEPEEKERKINPMSGRHVNKEGEIRDENGDVIGRLTAGDLGRCIGLEIDDNGYVVDNDGNRVGEATLLENIVEEEVDEDESEEEKHKREDAELADKMGNICQQTLERVQPVMKQITEYIEQADRTPKDELDEEELVNNVKPLIEEGSRILQECNGSLRGLDPDGRIAQQAKGRAATREATPEEYRLADLLKELTTSVVTTIDNAKKKLQDMPHAKKKLNPLWALLTEPLFQIIAAVGLLLSGVLGLVGKLLNALGLGGLVNGLLGGLGIDKLLGGLGLGSVTDMLGGGKKEKKKGGGMGSLPLVGGLLGGK